MFQKEKKHKSQITIKIVDRKFAIVPQNKTWRSSNKSAVIPIYIYCQIPAVLRYHWRFVHSCDIVKGTRLPIRAWLERFSKLFANKASGTLCLLQLLSPWTTLYCAAKDIAEFFYYTLLSAIRNSSSEIEFNSEFLFSPCNSLFEETHE